MVRGSDSHRVAPRISRDGFVQLLQRRGSPVGLLAAEAVYYYAVGHILDPLLLLAIFNQESSLGTAGTATVTHSWGNVRSALVVDPAPTGITYGRSGSFPVWKNWYEGGVSTVNRLVSEVYPAGVPYGFRTIADIFTLTDKVWAPAGDLNNPAGYLAGVLAFMDAHQDLADLEIPMQQFADRILELPAGYNRPGTRLISNDAFVFHETDNENRGAGVQNTFDFISGRFNGGNRPEASFHFATDGVTPSAQFLPAGPHDAERCWAIGDVEGGSYRSVSGEICVNPDGDYSKAVIQMCKIAAKWLHAHGKSPIKNVNVRYHGSYWTPTSSSVHRYCPNHILKGDWGWTWDRVFLRVVEEYNSLGTSQKVPIESNVVQEADVKVPAAGTSVTQVVDGQAVTITNWGPPERDVVEANVNTVEQTVTVRNTKGARYNRPLKANVMQQFEEVR